MRAAGVASMALVLLAAEAAYAQSRLVIVNGRLLNDAQVLELSRMNCAPIPDGSYWLNLNNGAWGYAGDPRPRGVLGAACGGGSIDHDPTRNQDGTLGPFATLRRAEEVANQYRGRGLRAVAFHNGDGYYVRVGR